MGNYLYRKAFNQIRCHKRENQLKTANGRKFIWDIIHEKFDSSDG